MSLWVVAFFPCEDAGPHSGPHFRNKQTGEVWSIYPFILEADRFTKVTEMIDAQNSEGGIRKVIILEWDGAKRKPLEMKPKEAIWEEMFWAELEWGGEWKIKKHK
ncbi:hypothetical protein HQ544_00060 [Candidatus Falkowbacteria bacterium]|nr:hypothetical protein [Candidatus Falkowbacteria bacterium]